MQKLSLCGTIAPPQSKNYKNPTGQRAKIHEFTQFYLYQISHFPVKENLKDSCKTPTTGSHPHLGSRRYAQ
jgi:hypothetical protein